MPFNPFEEKFNFRGKNLIEASAGTGKTYSITAIYLRLILEKEMLPAEIPVVTFTVDATEELKRRIMEIIKIAYNFFYYKTGASVKDDNLKKYLESLDRNKVDRFLSLLKESLIFLDDAPVYTIHKFCKRILSENPVETGIPVNMEFSAKESEFLKEFMFYIYRKWLYKEDKLIAYIFYEKFVKDSVFGEIISKYTSATEFYFKYGTDVCLKSVKKSYDELFDEYERVFKNSPSDKDRYLREFFSYFADKDSYMLFDKLKNVSKSLTFIKKYETLYKLYKKTIKNAYVYITNRILQELKKADEYMYSLKTEKNVITFSDLIRLVFNASLKGKLNTSAFKALLIDEFQDTDFLQVRIFEKLFFDKAVFYIGDPKQSIYRFRNADLSAYFFATKDIKNRFYLDVCFRSTKGLTDAFNKIFNADGFFMDKRIRYEAVKPLKKPKMKVVFKDSKNRKDFNFCFLKDVSNKADVLPYLKKEIMFLLDEAEIENQKGDKRRLKPEDICILVRNNYDAENIRDYFTKEGLKCSLTTTKSVFETKQATEILFILKAINNFTNSSHIKSALVFDIFHKTAQEAVMEKTIATYKEKFLHYKELLRRNGVMACFLHIFNAEDSKRYVLSKTNGERIYTNYLHILELLQESQKKENPEIEKLIKYLQSKINNPSLSSEEEELRLESDENAIKISTIHKSKGLEFPVVFLLYFSGQSKSKQGLTLSFEFDENLKKHTVLLSEGGKDGNKDEEARLLYVALTRAISRCYLFDYKRKGGGILNELLYNNKSKAGDIVKELEDKFSDVASIKTECTAHKESIEKTEDKEFTALRFMDFRGTIERKYTLSSYSAMVGNAHMSYEEDVYEEFDNGNFVAETPILPAGAKTGSIVHKILEKINFNISNDELKEVLLSEMSGYSKEAVEYAFKMIKNVLNAPFKIDNKEFRLSNLERSRRISEMQFFISVKDMDRFLGCLADIFNKKGSVEFADGLKTIKALSLKHYLMGFIDLVFEFNGKIHIIDWKTNYLGSLLDDYSFDNLHKEIISNSYFLQFSLYQLAVYQYISTLKANVDTGESFYIFTRGFMPEKNRGIYRYAFNKDELNELARYI